MMPFSIAISTLFWISRFIRSMSSSRNWSHAKEILKGHIITGTLYDIYVGNIVYGLQQKILEHANRGFCCSTIILAILIGKFLIDKSEIYKIINAAKKIVLGDNYIVE